MEAKRVKEEKEADRKDTLEEQIMEGRRERKTREGVHERRRKRED